MLGATLDMHRPYVTFSVAYALFNLPRGIDADILYKRTSILWFQSELVTYSDSNSSSVVSGPEFNEEEFDATEEFPEDTDLSPRTLDFFNLQDCSDNCKCLLRLIKLIRGTKFYFIPSRHSHPNFIRKLACFHKLNPES
ncbi:unnamed protein product [Dicrocoelium dendriticum]|nr:unnamed protein product [Dicrocoelium dendriticum]